MRSHRFLLSGLAALVLLAGCAPGAAHRSPGDVLEDAQIHAALKTRLIDDPRVDANEVNVEVREGVVTLVGWVTDSRESQTVEQLAWSVNGVKDVRNLLQVRASSPAASSPQG